MNIVREYTNTYGYPEALALDQADGKWIVTLCRKTGKRWGPAPLSACNRMALPTEAAAHAYIAAWNPVRWFALVPPTKLGLVG